MKTQFLIHRGTSSKTHWNLNLDYGKVEINLERDFTLPDLDRDDGLSLDYLNFDLGGVLLSTTHILR